MECSSRTTDLVRGGGFGFLLVSGDQTPRHVVSGDHVVSGGDQVAITGQDIITTAVAAVCQPAVAGGCTGHSGETEGRGRWWTHLQTVPVLHTTSSYYSIDTYYHTTYYIVLCIMHYILATSCSHCIGTQQVAISQQIYIYICTVCTRDCKVANGVTVTAHGDHR